MTTTIGSIVLIGGEANMAALMGGCVRRQEEAHDID